MISDLALAYVHESNTRVQPKFSLKDLIGDGYLLAVPKFRRTIEKRLKRKYGHPDYHMKILLPKTNLKMCLDCGHHHERGVLCGKYIFAWLDSIKKFLQYLMEDNINYTLSKKLYRIIIFCYKDKSSYIIPCIIITFRTLF